MIKKQLHNYKLVANRRIPYTFRIIRYRLGVIKKIIFSPQLRSDNSKVDNEKLLLNPFFIVGSGRSGTTLLRSILSEHPDVFIPPENQMLRYMAKAFDAYRGLPWRVQVAAVLEEFEKNEEFSEWEVDLFALMARVGLLKKEDRTFAELVNLIYTEYGSFHAPGKTRWGDKTPDNAFNLDLIEKHFPNAQYIHMLRDGRDSVASFFKSNFYNGDIIRAAYKWRDSVRFCRRFKKKVQDKRRFFELRYEDLVFSPDKKIKEICNYLNIDVTEKMLQYKGASSNMKDVLNKKKHQNVNRGIFTKSIGHWEQDIPKSDIRKVLKIIEGELRFFGYIS